MRRFTAVLRKDLRLELRGGESTIALVSIALLVLIVLVFALDPAGGARDAQAAAGSLWIALIFAGMIGAGRVLLAERDNGCLRALILSPIDPATLYLAKLAASFIFMAVAEVSAVTMMVLFFNLAFDERLLRLAPL
ncbi:MAG TPA: heme exporter protein CcmB, partial [Candidatus Binataceae bacterium]|nr:heme exporter protein CcmB [Candidatus Binataceae bacterium]